MNEKKSEQQAKQAVVKAGIELVASGLIVRTWGNISCRIDETRFAITPSGRAYEGLTADDIVVCNIADASYSGDIKPSSEKGAHAVIYRGNRDADFVVHTHQKYATAVASSGLVSMNDGQVGHVPVAAYGLPGTKKLMRGVEVALPRANGAILMSHHGAICYGKNYEETFAAAYALEQACESFMYSGYEDGAGACDTRALLDDYIIRTAGDLAPARTKGTLHIKSSRREGTGFRCVLLEGESLFPDFASAMPDEARLHAAIYAARPDLNNIELADDENVIAVSLAKKPLAQLVDDFAQMIGQPMRIARGEVQSEVVRALGKTGGVLIAGAGALCCAATETDAHAVRLVTEKNALAEVCATMIGESKPIAAVECSLMHLIYTKSYSKRAAATK